jgi:hypothetical protein
MMLRQSAVDMENSQNLLGEGVDGSVYQARAKYLGITCCLILSYGMFFSLGFYEGYLASYDGSLDGTP